MAKIEEKIENHCEQNRIDFANLNKKMDEFIKSADYRFASKLTEKVVYGLVGMIVTAFITLLLIKVGWS